jgi:hypothetical protein
MNPEGTPSHCRRRREQSLTGPRRLNKTRAAKNLLETPHVVSYISLFEPCRS